MLPLTRMTPEQIESYRPIWGAFLHIGNTFPGRYGGTHVRTFGFYGSLEIREEGLVSLGDLLVACSCEDAVGEQTGAIRGLEEQIAEGQWRTASGAESEIEGVWQGFRLSLFSRAGREGRTATHLLLSYGDAEAHRHSYLRACFPAEQGAAGHHGPPMGHFYPVGTHYAPEKAETLAVPDLARRLRGKAVVAFTGAGISLSSGIPTFRGADGLARYFPLHERFPGAVVDWMIGRPRELAQVLGRFQACFITAQPGAAHRSLAALEERGCLLHLITGNGDRLHERAGSRQVHLKDPCDFGEAGQGWRWIREGSVFLVVGVSRDEHGFLSYARDQGLQVVVIAPERPSFLYAEDWFVPGRAEELLPDLAARLVTGPSPA